jgi:hypothetical protein
MENEQHFRPQMNSFYCISLNISRGASVLGLFSLYLFFRVPYFPLHLFGEWQFNSRIWKFDSCSFLFLKFGRRELVFTHRGSTFWNLPLT